MPALFLNRWAGTAGGAAGDFLPAAGTVQNSHADKN